MAEDITQVRDEVEVGPEKVLSEIFKKNPADGTFLIEYATVVSWGQPHLVAGLYIIDHSPEKWGLDRLNVIKVVAGDKFGDEFRCVLLEKDIALYLLENV